MPKIEVDLSHAQWRASAGGSDDGACVEVAVVPGSKEASDHSSRSEIPGTRTARR